MFSVVRGVSEYRIVAALTVPSRKSLSIAAEAALASGAVIGGAEAREIEGVVLICGLIWMYANSSGVPKQGVWCPKAGANDYAMMSEHFSGYLRWAP